MKKILILILTLFQVNAFCQENDKKYLFIDTLQSKFLDENQAIQVYLPPDYYNSNDIYPLQVVLGGNSRTRMYYSISEYLSETYQILELNQLHTIPESIVVGLGHAPRNNMENYRKFVFYEVLPLVDSKYRKCHYKSLVGHSQDGEFVLQSLFSEESPFHAYFCSAPTNSDYFIGELNNEANVSFLKNSKKRLLIVASQQDYFYEENLKLIDTFKKISNGTFLFKSIVKSSDNHHSIFPVSITDALFFIFNDWLFTIPDSYNENTTDLFLKHYEILSEKIGLEIAPPEFDFYLLAYLFDVRKLTEEKIELLKKCKEYYPEAMNADAYLARTYYTIGDLKNAMIYNERSISLNPNNEFAIQTKELIEKKR